MVSWLLTPLHDRVARKGRVALVPGHHDVALFTPVGAPAVLDQPVVPYSTTRTAWFSPQLSFLQVQSSSTPVYKHFVNVNASYNNKQL